MFTQEPKSTCVNVSHGEKERGANSRKVFSIQSNLIHFIINQTYMQGSRPYALGKPVSKTVVQGNSRF